MSTTRRFFSESPATGNAEGSLLHIEGDEFYHLKNVNRAAPGDSIEVIDGSGSMYLCVIRQLKPNRAVVEVRQIQQSEKTPVRVIIAPSLLKQRPMNLIIEKLTELGVDEIRPVMFQRTDETYSPSRLKKWHRIAIQSLKVNKRLWTTQLYPPTTIDDLLVNADGTQTKILLDKTGDNLESVDGRFPAIAVVGPPGGFLPEEREQFIAGGFRPMKINPNNLKTETAAISIAAILNTTY
jgi:16S rRNA (uracil1498-N3)-methyltransferase